MEPLERLHIRLQGIGADSPLVTIKKINVTVEIEVSCCQRADEMEAAEVSFERILNASVESL